ncbi:MAG: helix-turn-helix transcriptional regulator [bacterium]|nr:helix-turn-helix transcriptional regulator [bacterium]
MIHIGQNIRHIRELRGLKQDVLAMELGISQQTVSHLEQSETVAEEMLLKIATVLGVSRTAIVQFSSESFLDYCSSFQDNAIESNQLQPPINSLVIELYERLLQAEREKLAYVEKMLGSKL